MWVFADEAFISIAALPHNDDHLVVRARFSEDIAKLFPDAQIVATPHRDYAFCASIPRDEVIAVVAGRIQLLRETEPDNAERYENYFDVWAAMRMRNRPAQE